LGEFIFGGIALNNTNMILAGAIPAALLAIIFDFILAKIQSFEVRKTRGALIAIPAILIFLSSFYLLPSVIGSKMLAGFTPEFMGRSDGFLGLKNKYGLDIRTVVISDAVMYKAAYEKQLDVISGYSTDGRLKAFDLVVLKDDQVIFPPYYAAPIVNEKLLQKYPEVEGVLNMLAGRINDSVMTNLNYKVDYLKQSPERVAKDFLTQNNLFKEAGSGHKGVVRIGSKIFGEQYILVQMYSMLIKGYTDLSVEAKTGLGGTKICFDALTNNQIDVYPEYSGTGLLVILQAQKKIVDKIIDNKDKVFEYVKNEFQKKYKIVWLKPIGFNNAYAVMMRRKQAAELKIQTISQLKMFIDHN
jgi:osmoprotectant transport system permease protein